MPGFPLAQIRAGGGLSLGQAAPQASATNVSVGAFGPGATAAPATSTHPLSPTQPFGLAFWVGVGCIVVLGVIRHSLPR